MHSTHKLRSRKWRRALLESTELSSLRDNGLETERGLDVGDALLASSLPLLLGSHLASKRLLLSRIALARGREDVLERLLRLTICDIARSLTALEQAKSLRTTLDIRVGDSLSDRIRLTERLQIAEDVSGGRSTRADGLLSRPHERRVKSASLSETGGYLTLEIATHLSSSTRVLRGRRKTDTLVGGSFWNSLRLTSGRSDVLQEAGIELVSFRIKSLEFSEPLLSERFSKRHARGDLLLSSLQLHSGLFWGQSGKSAGSLSGQIDVTNPGEISRSFSNDIPRSVINRVFCNSTLP